MKALVGALNQEKALVGAFSVIVKASPMFYSSTVDPCLIAYLVDILYSDSIARHVLGVELDKDWNTRTSNWEADTLTQTQLEYAANDALVAVNITWVIIREDIIKNVFKYFELYINYIFSLCFGSIQHARFTD